jgi:hypothetical protein
MRGVNKVLFYFRVNFLVAIILLAMPSLGGAELMNQDVLAQSKIKESSFKQIFNDIKKTLPKELKHCPILVANIKLLKQKNGGVAEDWTVNICQETRAYFVSNLHPKGYFCEVVPREDQLAHEMKIWNAAKKDGDEDYWRKILFYVN